MYKSLDMDIKYQIIGTEAYLKHLERKNKNDFIHSVVEPKGKVCKHTRIEEIQGGQIERCRDCGKQWG